jgi:hypothetical protein
MVDSCFLPICHFPSYLKSVLGLAIHGQKSTSQKAPAGKAQASAGLLAN